MLRLVGTKNLRSNACHPSLSKQVEFIQKIPRIDRNITQVETHVFVCTKLHSKEFKLVKYFCSPKGEAYKMKNQQLK
jgi:hypothetical protein